MRHLIERITDGIGRILEWCAEPVNKETVNKENKQQDQGAINTRKWIARLQVRKG